MILIGAVSERLVHDGQSHLLLPSFLLCHDPLPEFLNGDYDPGQCIELFRTTAPERELPKLFQCLVSTNWIPDMVKMAYRLIPYG